MLLKLCHMILLLYKCSRYKGRKCDELSSEVLPGCQERDDFFLLLVYLHFLINFKGTHTVRGVYDVIAIALLFLKSKIQSSTQGPGAEHRRCDGGFLSLCPWTDQSQVRSPSWLLPLLSELLLRPVLPGGSCGHVKSSQQDTMARIPWDPSGCLRAKYLVKILWNRLSPRPENCCVNEARQLCTWSLTRKRSKDGVK